MSNQNSENVNFQSVTKQLENLLFQSQKEIELTVQIEDLFNVKSRYLGRKSELSELLRLLPSLEQEERSRVGQLVNQLKQTIEQLVEQKAQVLRDKLIELRLLQSRIDVSRPERQNWRGSLHPLTQVQDRICHVLTRLGFDFADGPQIEHDFYNFESLNFPKNHPARAMQDTFFIHPEVLLRTHTSPVQVRVMNRAKPPIRIICPGAVYRRDADLTHSPMFHQVEGLWVDEEVSLADLKGVLRTFAEQMFGAHTQIRLRPSFFPFVEPGVEVDVSCLFCRGTGCRVCKNSGFLEVLGAGMVHPNVLVNIPGATPRLRGFAFGMGVERIAMLLLGVNDIRLFFENDTRFLEQF